MCVCAYCVYIYTNVMSYYFIPYYSSIRPLLRACVCAVFYGFYAINMLVYVNQKLTGGGVGGGWAKANPLSIWGSSLIYGSEYKFDAPKKKGAPFPPHIG